MGAGVCVCGEGGGGGRVTSCTLWLELPFICSCSLLICPSERAEASNALTDSEAKQTQTVATHWCVRTVISKAFSTNAPHCSTVIVSRGKGKAHCADAERYRLRPGSVPAPARGADSAAVRPAAPHAGVTDTWRMPDRRRRGKRAVDRRMLNRCFGGFTALFNGVSAVI